MVLLVASLFSNGPLAATAALTVHQAQVLALVRSYALDYTAKLPDFICTQVTRREISLLNIVNYQIVSTTVVASDEIEEQLTFSSQRESYEVLYLNRNRVTGFEHTQIPGAVSAGEFGSLLRDIFDPRTHAIFEWDRSSGPRDHRLYVFAFHVPKESGIHVVDNVSGQDTVAPYRGRVFVNANTNEVERIDSQVDFRPEFAVKAAKRSVEYRRVSVADKDYSLPFHSEVRMWDATHVYVNRMDYRAYHKYAVTAGIRIDAETNGLQVTNPVPNPLSVKESAPAVRATDSSVDSLPNSSGVSLAKTEPAQSPAVAEIAPPSPLHNEAKSVTALPLATPESKINAPPATVATAENTPAVKPLPSREEPTILRTQVNLVLVPVVVRDGSGKAVGDLTKDDFQVFDRGKQQQITNFSIQKFRSDISKNSIANSPGQLPTSSAAVAPSNFVGYWFDDVHLSVGDVVRVRDGAIRKLETLNASDRIAIFTSSGQGNFDFTGDREKLRNALMNLRQRPLGETSKHECPDISYYMADLIINKRDTNAFEQATDDAVACMHLLQMQRAIAAGQVQSVARGVLMTGEQASRRSLVSLKEAVRKLSVMPGSRSILVLSPGFFCDTDLQFAEQDVLDLAVHSQVVISAIDARGLYVLNQAGDIEQNSGDAKSSLARADYARNEAILSSGLLASVAAGSGGTFIQNTNDLSGGLQRLAAPEYSYLLEFTPHDLKNDEKFHPIKVRLRSHKKLTVQARSGYFAPEQAVTR